jgi:hypothetical protein
MAAVVSDFLSKPNYLLVFSNPMMYWPGSLLTALLRAPALTGTDLFTLCALFLALLYSLSNS